MRKSYEIEQSDRVTVYSLLITHHLCYYLLARRGRNERVKAARGGVARANGLLAISLFLPPNAGNTTRATVCPVSRSIARIDISSTGVTMVIARPVLPARPVRPMRCT